MEAWDYDLPDELIATTPAAQRTASRLMHLDVSNGSISHYSHFSSLADRLNEGDLLVFNNSQVVSARMHARKETGGRVEIFALDVVRPDGHKRWVRPLGGGSLEIEAMTRSSKSLRSGQILTVDENCRFEVLEWSAGIARLRALDAYEESPAGILEQFGEMPLPPYILKQRAERDEDYDADSTRYQTVYASKPGAVAAPTAGLHFTEQLLDELESHGVQTAFVTLHVGAGTFRPVTSENLSEHEMHSEAYEIPEGLGETLESTRARGGRVVAVGTTTVRTLESEMRRDHPFVPGYRTTDLFLKPGSSFDAIDAMITNFHLPRSTLLALVAAFSGYELLFEAYREAVDRQYRFYSYGDAMFIDRGAR